MPSELHITCDIVRDYVEWNDAKCDITPGMKGVLAVLDRHPYASFMKKIVELHPGFKVILVSNFSGIVLHIFGILILCRS